MAGDCEANAPWRRKKTDAEKDKLSLSRPDKSGRDRVRLCHRAFYKAGILIEKLNLSFDIKKINIHDFILSGAPKTTPLRIKLRTHLKTASIVLGFNG
jgi:hypothetical protein